MIAAVYARESTEQNGVMDDQKSVSGRLNTRERTRSVKDGPLTTRRSLLTTESAGLSLPTGPAFFG
jgi:hypothetical protein